MLPLIYTMVLDTQEERNKLETLYNLYRKRMLITADSVLHNKSDAEDVVQDTFLSIARNLDSIEDVYSSTGEAYCIRAVKNRAFNYRRNRITCELDDNINYTDDIADSVLEEIATEQNYDNLIRCIRNLDAKYRDVITYHYVNEMTAKKIAEITGLKIATVKQRLVRGKKLLLKMFEDKEM